MYMDISSVAVLIRGVCPLWTIIQVIIRAGTRIQALAWPLWFG